ncbi:hypothetical protein ACA910_016153 [Epithemia clementina (nom. ined.)]
MKSLLRLAIASTIELIDNSQRDYCKSSDFYSHEEENRCHGHWAWSHLVRCSSGGLVSFYLILDGVWQGAAVFFQIQISSESLNRLLPPELVR